MPKNIVVCCDGTANEFAKDRTNVIKLYSILVQDSAIQTTYYHPGLGTMEPAGALTPWARKIIRLLGKAVGYGLSDDIRDAYVYLMSQYEPGDRVYIFGFSRGAYTVRAIAALLKGYGLIRRGNETLVPYAIRMQMGIHEASQGNDPAQFAKYCELAKEFKATMSIECKPYFVGVWDTVCSVGWVENPLSLPYESNNPDIAVGRHAIAIDERRAFFRTHLWIKPVDAAREFGPKDMLQVWFPGVHCDVGGGYPENQSGLSKGALDWMLQEAKAYGLLVQDAKEQEVLGKSNGSQYCKQDPNDTIHESLEGLWVFAEFIWKKHWNWARHKWEHRPNLFRCRTIPPKSLVHDSAYLRGDDYAKRLPPDAIRATTRDLGKGASNAH
jgi:uncharacterized protein (DUF2235 family)